MAKDREKLFEDVAGLVREGKINIDDIPENARDEVVKRVRPAEGLFKPAPTPTADNLFKLFAQNAQEFSIGLDTPEELRGVNPEGFGKEDIASGLGAGVGLGVGFIGGALEGKAVFEIARRVGLKGLGKLMTLSGGVSALTELGRQSTLEAVQGGDFGTNFLKKAALTSAFAGAGGAAAEILPFGKTTDQLLQERQAAQQVTDRVQDAARNTVTAVQEQPRLNIGVDRQVDPTAAHVLNVNRANIDANPVNAIPPKSSKTSASIAESISNRTSFKVGQRVRPRDRNNIGEITSINEKEGTATVFFHNRKTGEQATKTFSLDDLGTGDKGGERLSKILAKGQKTDTGDLFRGSNLQIEGNEGAQKVIDSLRASREINPELRGHNKSFIKKSKSFFNRWFLDTSGNVKEELNKFGPDGQRATRAHTLALGSSGKAEFEFDKLSNEVYKGLNSNERELFDYYLISKRIKELGDIRPEVENPGGITARDADQYIKMVEADPKLKDAFDKRSKVYFEAMRDQLNQMRQAGLISQETFDELKDFNYVKREFLDKIDPEIEGLDEAGNKIRVRSSGLKPLKQGSTGAMETDTEFLAAEVITRAQARIAKNKANRALVDFKNNNPNNGIVYDIADELPEDIGRFQRVEYFEDGVKRDLLMPTEFAKEWVLRDPAINRTMAEILNWSSGTAILKASATGLNPEFTLSNLPRDMAFVYMNTDEYSSFLPRFMTQIGGDLLAVSKDAWRKTGAYEDFVRQGGSFDFLTAQAGFGSGARRGPLKGLRRVMGKLGEFSETLTRLAVRRRALKNGATPEEATFIARNYLDFAQGGRAAKVLDNVFPYLNASIQGTRGAARFAKNNPASFLWKSSQIGALAGGLYFMNRATNLEGWNMLSDEEKNRNWVFMLPEAFATEDEDGNLRHRYLRIPKDQTQRGIAAVFEGLLQRDVEGKFPSDKVLNSFEEILPILPQSTMPPVLAAFAASYANKDFWTNEDVWRGPEVSPELEFYPESTHQAFIDAGQKLGISPIRTERAAQKILTYGNVWTELAGYSYDVMTTALGREEKRKVFEDISQEPFFRKFTRLTPRRNKKEYEAIKDVSRNINGFRLKNNRKVDELLKGIDSGEAQVVDLERFVKSWTPNEQKRLERRIRRDRKLNRIPPRYKPFLLDLYDINSPEGRAQVFWNKLNSIPDQSKSLLLQSAEMAPGLTSKRFLAEIRRLRGR